MKHLKYLSAIIIALAMVACSSNDEYATKNQTGHPINIKPSVASMLTKSINGSDLQNNSFNDGAKINVYLTNSSTGSSIDNLSNGYATYTFTKSTNKWQSNVDGLKYPETGSVNAYAIYPATVTTSDNSFEVLQEQHIKDNYLKSDLMYAYSTNNTVLNDPIKLEFNHCLAKVTVKLKPSAGMTNQDIIDNIGDIDLKNVKRTANIIHTGNKITATATGSAESIYMGTSTEFDINNGVSCIVIPQTIQADTELFYIATDFSTNFVYYAPTGGITFAAGNEYVFTITLGDSGITSSSHYVKSWNPIDYNVVAQPD